MILEFIRWILGVKVITAHTKETVAKDWQEIETLLKGGTPSQLKQALINADRSVDTLLKDLVAGESMGERLKNAKNLLHPETYNKVWEAHKLRNSLVHEGGFEVQHFMLKGSVGHLKSAVGGLGVKL